MGGELNNFDTSSQISFNHFKVNKIVSNHFFSNEIVTPHFKLINSFFSFHEQFEKVETKESRQQFLLKKLTLKR